MIKISWLRTEVPLRTTSVSIILLLGFHATELTTIENSQISTLVSRLLNFFNVASATGIPSLLHTRAVSSG